MKTPCRSTLTHLSLFAIGIWTLWPSSARADGNVVPRPDPPPGAVFSIWSYNDTGMTILDRPEDATFATIPLPICDKTVDIAVPGGCIKSGYPQCVARIALGADQQNVQAVYYGFRGEDVIRIGAEDVSSGQYGKFMCSEQEVQDNGYTVVSQDKSATMLEFPAMLASLTNGVILAATTTIPCYIKSGGIWFVRPGCTTR